jgi:hypothetical protein
MTTLLFDRIKKQDLLLMGVRCKKITPEAFLDYISTQKKEDYDNLDAWGVKEL